MRLIVVSGAFARRSRLNRVRTDSRMVAMILFRVVVTGVADI